MPQKRFGNWQDRFIWSILAGALVCALLPRQVKLKITQLPATGLLLPIRGIAAVRSTIITTNREKIRLSQIAAELALENARLNFLVRTQEVAVSPSFLSLIRAPIIARDITTLRRYLIISRGTRDGVHNGAVALVPDGVVGRVIATTFNQALVQTLFEPDFRMVVTSIRSRDLALARPGPDGMLLLDYTAKNADFQPGDSIITSGLGGVFPKGLKVGYVVRTDDQSDALFRPIFVQPFADIGRLEQVFILRVPESLPALFRQDWLDNLNPVEITVPE